MKRRRYFFRQGAEPAFLEDDPSVILVGRWTHIYNLRAKEWFQVTNAPEDPTVLMRPAGIWNEITFREWFQRVPKWRAFIVLVEDFTGICLGDPNRGKKSPAPDYMDEGRGEDVDRNWRLYCQKDWSHLYQNRTKEQARRDTVPPKLGGGHG